MEARIEELAKQLRQSPNSFAKQRELMSVLRSSKIRRSDLVNEFGGKLLEKSRSKLGDEVWMVYEQVLIARLDLGNTEGAKKIYFELKHKFGASSSRVQRLRGMILESTDVTGAKSLYKALREQDPLNQLYFKRLVCCEKADGNLKEAIKILLEYLDIHPSDVNAWEELAELYIKTENYKQAAFCYEEVILWKPQSFHHINFLAETYFTLGGLDNLVLARKYYSQSLLLNKTNNLRGLFGLQATTSAILSQKGAKQEENEKLNQWAATELLEAYRGHELQSLIENLVKV